jgi:hypothetical protein
MLTAAKTICEILRRVEGSWRKQFGRIQRQHQCDLVRAAPPLHRHPSTILTKIVRQIRPLDSEWSRHLTLGPANSSKPAWELFGAKKGANSHAGSGVYEGHERET